MYRASDRGTVFVLSWDLLFLQERETSFLSLHRDNLNLEMNKDPISEIFGRFEHGACIGRKGEGREEEGRNTHTRVCGPS